MRSRGVVFYEDKKWATNKKKLELNWIGSSLTTEEKSNAAYEIQIPLGNDDDDDEMKFKSHLVIMMMKIMVSKIKF